MIIWGSKGRTKTINSGRFFCPECRVYCDYNQVELKRWFTLYFIPVFPMETLSEYIECQSCKGTYRSNVLDYDPIKENQKFNAMFFEASLTVMAKLALSDGVIDENEVTQIARSFGNLTGREIETSDVHDAIKRASEDTSHLSDIIKNLTIHLNDNGREILLRSAILVAKADGNVHESELRQLKVISDNLMLPPAYLRGILVEEGISLKNINS